MKTLKSNSIVDMKSGLKNSLAVGMMMASLGFTQAMADTNRLNQILKNPEDFSARLAVGIFQGGTGTSFQVHLPTTLTGNRQDIYILAGATHVIMDNATEKEPDAVATINAGSTMHIPIGGAFGGSPFNFLLDKSISFNAQNTIFNSQRDIFYQVVNENTVDGLKSLELGEAPTKEGEELYLIGYRTGGNSRARKCAFKGYYFTDRAGQPFGKGSTIQSLMACPPDGVALAGTSGGPVVNANGDVVGVFSQDTFPRWEDQSDTTKLAKQISDLQKTGSTDVMFVPLDKSMLNKGNEIVPINLKYEGRRTFKNCFVPSDVINSLFLTACVLDESRGNVAAYSYFNDNGQGSYVNAPRDLQTLLDKTGAEAGYPPDHKLELNKQYVLLKELVGFPPGIYQGNNIPQ